MAEALTSARIAHDAVDPRAGPCRLVFGEAQLFVGLSRMAVGVALEQVRTACADGVEACSADRLPIRRVRIACWRGM